MSIGIALKQPFTEAVNYFRAKVNIPTAKWDDLWKGQHARGFMIAGAAKAELLGDFRAAVDRAISEGTTLETFRKDFDAIVEKHGWSYKGGHNWRSAVIYNTNIRTAYQAGRWQQLTDPEQLKINPDLEYRHSDWVRTPRLQHVAWDGLTLPADDPWWKTHYPPNGWGCRCRVFAANDRTLARAGKAGPDTAPPDRIDPATGAPEGIEKGWDYNVGQAADRGYRTLADKFEGLPNDIARAWMREFTKSEAFDEFLAGKVGDVSPVAVLNEDLQGVLTAAEQTAWVRKTEAQGLERAFELQKLLDQGQTRIIDQNTVTVTDATHTAHLTKDGAGRFWLTAITEP